MLLLFLMFWVKYYPDSTSEGILISGLPVSNGVYSEYGEIITLPTQWDTIIYDAPTIFRGDVIFYHPITLKMETKRETKAQRLTEFGRCVLKHCCYFVVIGLIVHFVK